MALLTVNQSRFYNTSSGGDGNGGGGGGGGAVVKAWYSLEQALAPDERILEKQKGCFQTIPFQT